MLFLFKALKAYWLSVNVIGVTQSAVTGGEAQDKKRYSIVVRATLKYDDPWLKMSHSGCALV